MCQTCTPVVEVRLSVAPQTSPCKTMADVPVGEWWLGVCPDNNKEFPYCRVSNHEGRADNIKLEPGNKRDGILGRDSISGQIILSRFLPTQIKTIRKLSDPLKLVWQ